MFSITVSSQLSLLQRKCVNLKQFFFILSIYQNLNRPLKQLLSRKLKNQISMLLYKIIIATIKHISVFLHNTNYEIISFKWESVLFAVTNCLFQRSLLLDKQGLMHVFKGSSMISLCSVNRLIWYDTFYFNGFFCLKKVCS